MELRYPASSSAEELIKLFSDSDFNHEGRPLACSSLEFARNNERIPATTLAYDLPRFVFDRASHASQVIVHRDGRYLQGEDQDILDGFHAVERVTLVSIKKDSATRLNGEATEGCCMRIDEQCAILITNAQAKQRGMPAPIEVELAEPGDRRLGEVVAQVFWLTRVCQGNAWLPKRLPATTGWANSIASTGRIVHFKGWEYVMD